MPEAPHADEAHPAPERKARRRSSLKETITSITIAFICAFVFRAFVIEAFVIPTGSMAPTLMGAHMRVHSDVTGYTWAVGPTHFAEGQMHRQATVTDPMLGPGRRSQVSIQNERMRAGDRILVLKYLRGIFEPERFDVVVFKSPEDPRTNFIKRLTGLPGEAVALIDGDVYYREGPLPDAAPNPWAAEGWDIARKPERVQLAIWQEVFNSFYTPLDPVVDGRRWFSPPWVGGEGWAIEGPSYRYEGEGRTTLAWDEDRWPIRDYYPYDETIPSRARRDDRFPVADLCLGAGVQPEGTLEMLSCIVEARGHEFRGDLYADGRVVLRMRQSPADADGPKDWTILAEGRTDARLAPGQVTNVEFWHVDQSLVLRVGGEEIIRAPYTWSPEERILYATGRTLADLLAEPAANVFADASIYRRPTVRWEFEGSPLTLHRVRLSRDIYYQPSTYHMPRNGEMHARAGEPAAGTHPAQPVTLSETQYFVCGDNSPASSDARLWDAPAPWAALIDDTIGVVPAKLMIGRAFMVYFPSPVRRFGLPVPDTGRLRLIW